MGGTAWRRRMAAGAATIAVGTVMGAVPAMQSSAHTETSFVAVPAGEEATVSFQPVHGCGESPTVGVRVQAPVPDARAVDVDGWTATATPDGAGNTVLEWTGGLLRADQRGAFPVELTVPDAVGTLLAFPAIQRCENGEELAWIGTAPGDQYPAPQVLVLAAGSEPAPTLQDVPQDAPGRELLVALAEGLVEDNPAAAPTTAAPAAAAPTTIMPATTAPTTTAPTTLATTTVATATSEPSTTSSSAPTSSGPPNSVPATGGDDDGNSTAAIVALIAAVAVLGGGGAVLVARRRAAV